jgi:hypothetical protein
MQQDFDPNVLSNPPEIHRQMPVWGVAISVVVTALVVGITTYFYTSSTKQVVSVESTPAVTRSQMQSSSTPEPVVSHGAVIQDNSYIYGSKRLSLAKNPQLQNSDHTVTVYYSDGDSKSEIIREVPVDVAGDTAPEFKKTSKENVALLVTSTGDLGAFSQRNYYINLDTKAVLQINSTNGPTVEVTGTDGQFSEIELSITDDCGQDENRKENMSAVLKDITVNGKLQNAIAQTRELACVNPGGIGDVYSPSPSMSISGASSDLSKVFFVLSGDSWQSDSKTVLWKSNYSFDLSHKSVKEEAPVNAL